MFRLANPLFLICETPLHAGSGSDLGIVDLPIQRERHTDFPKIESSSLKGALREAFEEPCEIDKTIKVGKNTPTSTSLKAVTTGAKPSTKEYHKAIEADQYQHAIVLTFGKEDAGETAYSGSFAFTDARLLLFPVKSMKGVFAWITCPKALQQFVNDLQLSRIDLGFSVPDAPTAPHGCQLLINGKLILEEYAFDIQPEADAQGNCSKLASWLSQHLFPSQEPIYDYWRKKILTDLVVLSNDDFRDFVMLSTEVITRTKIDNATGTVARGALFTEEYLPSESVLYSLVLTSPIFKEKDEDKGVFDQREISEERLTMEFFRNAIPKVMQLGGDATIGKGIVRASMMEV